MQKKLPGMAVAALLVTTGMVAAPQAAFADTAEEREPSVEGPLEPLDPLPAPKPVISGKAAIGGKLSVSTSTRWEHPTVTYRWYVGTKAASMKLVGKSATLKIKDAWLGRKARVEVTGTEPGQPSVTKQSASVEIGVQKRKGQAAPKYSKGWYNFSIPWKGQQRRYWCGPASATMVLKKLGYTRSASGEKLTQARLASSKYFKTNKNGRSLPRYISSGLKKWIGKTQYRRINSPTTSELKRSISDSFTKTGRPVLVHITGKAGRPSVNHHGSYSYTHVMIVERWNPKTGKVVILDAGAKGHVWANAKPRFTMKITDLKRYLKEYGIYA